tara:strand:- start:80 stop:943 length:864 start_codon:yes stop_codon:yes gene_type:complete
MKQNSCIFLFIISVLLGDPEKTDVNHMIVMLNGETHICFIDSISKNKVFYYTNDNSNIKELSLKKIYYIYNDFNRVFHYSWSFEENVKRMNHRSGRVYKINGDTINFTNIEFNNDFIQPEIYITTGTESSEFIPLLDIEKVVTDYTIMHYSIKRGFYYSFSSFLISAGLDIWIKWDDSRRFSPQVWDQYNDLLPKITLAGMKQTGVTYESISFMVPVTVLGSMLYDLLREKNEFYFTPIYKDQKFARNMYVFSLGHITFRYAKSAVHKIENTKMGGKVIKWIRKKIA